MPMTKGLGVALAAVLAVLASGCDSGGGTTAATPTETTQASPTQSATVATTQSTVTQAEPPPVLDPPTGCQQAMADYHRALVKAGLRGFPPNEPALQRATLQSCTRDEWLEAVKPYTKGDYAIALVDPEKVLGAMCGSPPVQAPACS
jgi:hypothetical protein